MCMLSSEAFAELCAKGVIPHGVGKDFNSVPKLS